MMFQLLDCASRDAFSKRLRLEVRNDSAHCGKMIMLSLAPPEIFGLPDPEYDRYFINQYLPDTDPLLEQGTLQKKIEIMAGTLFDSLYLGSSRYDRARASPAYALSILFAAISGKVSSFFGAV